MGPYNTSKPLYAASLNLHSTIVILRGATRYLHLSRRLALQVAETSPQKSSVDPHALLLAANTIDELSTPPTSKVVLKKDSQLLETPQLASLHITQTHVNTTFPQTIQRLQHQASKPPTILMGRILYTLSPQTFPAQIRMSVTASAGTALLVIQRALSSGSMVRGGQTRTGGIDEARIIWTGLERAFKDVQREGKGVAVLERGLVSPTTDENEEKEERSGVTGLLELAKDGKDGLDGVGPSAWFWRECAAGMDKRFKDACRCMCPPFLSGGFVDGSVGGFGEDFEDWVSKVAEYGSGGRGGEYGGCERGIRWARSCLDVAEYCECPAISMRYSKLNVKTLERSDSIDRPFRFRVLSNY